MSVDVPPIPRDAGDTGLSDDNPWPGLLSFGEEDAKYFHGRDFESEMLARRVERERLTILFGPSGLGKSSILKAGLFPLLRKENVLPVYIRLDFSADRPDLTAQVKAAVVREAERSQVEAPRPTSRETLWEYFHRKYADFWSERHHVIIPLLVFDQFEEIFTLGRRDRSRTHATNLFLTELADLVEARPPTELKSRLERESPDKQSEVEAFHFDRHRYKVLFSLREDFLPELEALSDRMPAVAHNRFRLERMNGVSALQVVNQAPHLIGDNVGEELVRFVAKAEPDDELVDLEVEPALLSVVCRELNLRRQERRESQITEKSLAGTKEQILSDFYERSMADFDPAVCTLVEEKLLTRRGFRNIVAYDDALTIPGITTEVIDELVNRRLVRIEERAGVPRLELTHDLLTGVAAASRDERRRRLREAETVREIEERHRRSRKKAAALFLVLLLSFGAVGAFAWAYFAQAKAVELATAKIEADNAAAQAARQQRIAEEKSREAVAERAKAESALRAAEEAAREASRQKDIAEAERREAERQRAEAESARTAAERAAQEALFQKSVADRQRELAEKRQRELELSERRAQATLDELVDVLRTRLASRDPTDVLYALDSLVRVSDDAVSVLSRIDEAWFESSRSFVPLLEALENIAWGQPDGRWNRLRRMLVARFADRQGLPPPPERVSVKRVLLRGGELEMDDGSLVLAASHRVRVSPFYLQQHEVTNGEYRRFDPGHDPEAPDDHPVVDVSWYDAMVYAAWLGGTLPTQAQWEFAARGPSGRLYPWGGAPPTPRTANYDYDADRGTGGTMPVGSYPDGATPESVYDLAGNVWEWCRDGYLGRNRRQPRRNGVPLDPVGPAGAPSRVLKGGSFFNDARYLRTTQTNALHPAEKEPIVGFRVAWRASSAARAQQNGPKLRRRGAP